jgi:predicted TIM-barrel fold metal-dependent hydrolase
MPAAKVRADGAWEERLLKQVAGLVCNRQCRQETLNSIMTTRAEQRVVALEEHYADPQLIDRFQGWRDRQPARIIDRLLDLGDLRLKEMDEAGIDLQVLSHAPPGTQIVNTDDAVTLARRINDFLREAVCRHPNRYAAFAALPTTDPASSAEELERVVTKLGFKGAMVHGLTGGRFLDDRSYWTILERAQTLQVPIYIHPASPHPAVVEAYYKDRTALTNAGWGFGIECATQMMRMITGGVFDAYPRLQIIVGHLGEGLPFLLWRTNSIISRESKLPLSVRDYFCEHFYVTTNGNFSAPALQCTLAELGADRVMFGVDWPWAANSEGVAFIEASVPEPGVKDRILHVNAEQLLRL